MNTFLLMKLELLLEDVLNLVGALSKPRTKQEKKAN